MTNSTTSRRPPNGPASGSTIRYFGDYVLLGRIAVGGMGEVHNARQVSLNRPVALKLILAPTLATEAKVQRFHAEAEAAARLDHPNIVPVYEIGQYQGEHFISMRLVDGNSLAEQIHEGIWSRGRENEAGRQRKAAVLIAKTARAVHHAHQRGVIHRDLKPGNLLIDAQEEPNLTDFGLAKLLEGGHDLTVSKEVMGTAAYMAPEQAAGKSRDVTTATDVYSLGAVFYQLLTGSTPFQGEPWPAILNKITDQEPTAPKSLNPEIHRDLDTICRKCMAKEPGRRYASAEALAEDLERWLRGEPIQARRVPAWERGILWARRNPVTAALTGAVALSLLLGACGVTWQWRQAVRERARTQEANIRVRLQRAEDHLNDGQGQLGLAMLAKLAREDSGNRVAVERLKNALRQRRFLVPDSTQALVTNKSSVDPVASPGRVVISADGCLRAEAEGTTIEVRDLASGTLRWTHSDAHGSVIRSLNFDSGNQKLLSASSDGTAKVWLLTSNAPSLVLHHDEPVYYAEFSPDGSRLATASRDRTARLWDTATGQPIGERLNHHDAVNKVHFSPDGRWVVTASDDQTVRLWDAATGKSAGEPARFEGAVDDARFRADASHILVQPASGNWIAMRSTAGLLLRSSPPVAAVTGRKTAVKNNDPRLIALREQLTPRHAAEITFLELDPRGNLVATASMDKSACIWDAKTLAPVAPPLIHDAVVNCVRFSPDGLRVVTSSSNRKVRIWDVATGHPLSDWIASVEPVAAVSFSSDGHWVTSSAGWRWELAVSVGQAPDWLAVLAEAVSGAQMDRYDHATTSDPSAWREVRQRLRPAVQRESAPTWATDFITND